MVNSTAHMVPSVIMVIRMLEFDKMSFRNM